MTDFVAFDVTFFSSAPAARVLVGTTPANVSNTGSKTGIKLLYIVMGGILYLDRMLYFTGSIFGKVQVPSRISGLGSYMRIR